MTQVPRSLAFRLLHDCVRRDGAAREWRRAMLHERRSVEEQLDYQQRRLRDLVANAVAQVPYYGRALGGIPQEIRQWTLEDFMRLPLLDKAIIRAEGDGMLAEGLPASRRIANATSGSTGESLRFSVDAQSQARRRASTYRYYDWCGVSPFEPHAKLWGARFDEAPRTSLKDRIRAWMHPELFLSSYRLAEESLDEYSERLRRFQPVLLTSYPSPLTHFAQYCERKSIRLPSLRAIICSAEQLTPEQREIVEGALGVPIFDRYGSREFANVAQECEEHHGLHVATDRVWLEVLDSEGRACEPGKVGEIVITDFDNEVMPFIRYRTGDLGTWADGECCCGRKLPSLAAIEGRVLELIRTPSGRVISGTFWPQVVKQASKLIDNFQVRQVSPSQIDLILQTAGGADLPKSQENALLQKIQEFAPDLEVAIQFVDDIAPTRGGKRQHVVNLAHRTRG